MPDRVAWLAENSADDDFLFASGRFRGYVDLGPGVGEEIEDAGVEEALAWARDRSPVVLIRLWDSDYYSAGERNPDPDHYVEWPGEGGEVRPRRPRGLHALDHTAADAPVRWDVRLTADSAVDQAAFRVVVEADPRTLPVPAEQIDESVEGVRVLVRASTQAYAWSIAEELSTAAHEAVDPGARLRSRDRAGRGSWTRGWQVYPYAPDASLTFGGTIASSPQVQGRDCEDD